MRTYNRSIHRRTTDELDIHDITDEITAALGNLEVHNGTIHLFIPGSTASLTTIEYEPGAVSDLKALFSRLAPTDITYRHDLRWGDGNGHAHVRAALMGPSLSIPVMEGRLMLGTWQQVILLDFDNKHRNREILVQITAYE